MKDIKDSQKNINKELEVFKEDEKSLFQSFFEGLKLSHQMRRELIEWLPEIAYAEKCSVVDILGSEDLESVKNSKKLNNPQKLSKIREILYNRRYPELSQIKREWVDLTRSISPDKNRVQFKADPYFEKSEIELKLTAGNTKELKSLLEKLLDVDDKTWDKVIDPFKGVS